MKESFGFTVVCGFIYCLMVGCASLSDSTVPDLKNRTLRISPDIAGLEYQYEVCTNHFLGLCTGHKMVKETYDLTDLTMRAKLINMGFVARVKDQIVK